MPFLFLSIKLLLYYPNSTPTGTDRKEEGPKVGGACGGTSPMEFVDVLAVRSRLISDETKTNRISMRNRTSAAQNTNSFEGSHFLEMVDFWCSRASFNHSKNELERRLPNAPPVIPIRIAPKKRKPSVGVISNMK